MSINHTTLAERWPSMARAIGQQQRQQAADDFSRRAYGAVMSGIIRLDDRRRLGTIADRAGIPPFEAQLLIACAIRQWHLEQTETPRHLAMPASFDGSEHAGIAESAARQFLSARALLAAAAIVTIETLIVCACLW